MQITVQRTIKHTLSSLAMLEQHVPIALMLVGLWTGLLTLLVPRHPTSPERPRQPLSVSPHVPRSPRRAQLVFILGALPAFGPLSIDMYLPALPSLSRDFGTGTSQAQLTLSACLLGWAVGQAIAGPISDSLGRRRPLLVGLVAYALASLLCVVAPSVFVLVALRFVQGIAGAAGTVIARAIVRDLHTGVAAARFFSLLMLVNGLAPILLSVVTIGGIGLMGVLLPLFIIVSSLGFVLPNASALAMSDHPRTAGSASALIGVLQFAIGGAVASLVGVADPRIILPMSIVIATLGISALVAFILLGRGRS